MLKKQILVVDDELMLLYSLRRMLQEEYEVTIALGGKKALEFINNKNNHYDLIICDVSMPDINGVNLYLYVAEHHKGLERRIIFMTGGPTSIYLDDFFIKIPNLRLSKPFEAKQLLEDIKSVLETK